MTVAAFDAHAARRLEPAEQVPDVVHDRLVGAGAPERCVGLAGQVAGEELALRDAPELAVPSQHGDDLCCVPGRDAELARRPDGVPRFDVVPVEVLHSPLATHVRYRRTGDATTA